MDWVIEYINMGDKAKRGGWHFEPRLFTCGEASPPSRPLPRAKGPGSGSADSAPYRGLDLWLSVGKCAVDIETFESKRAEWRFGPRVLGRKVRETFKSKRADFKSKRAE